MRYRLDWSPRALRFLEKLDGQEARRILAKLELVERDPFRYLEHFEGRGCFKLRIGKYRALIDVDAKDRSLKIQVLDKRSRVYKR